MHLATGMATSIAGKVVAKMRELNRSGVLTKLEALDTKYLQKIFVGGPRNRDIELSEVTKHHTGPF